MPFYKYHCQKCHKDFVHVKSISENKPDCQICGAKKEMLYQIFETPPAIKIKGLDKNRFRR